ncbi:ABC transporter ATP-binding protein [Congregibacter variabilis]|uniref:ABC transporter ATP-binding protein n=1 Tax=Congregibacter variabilis TaxID=3081200 RepID=A0ABZ0I883_9GAMM|nr:ABC transporter ATP-binding protein [Congregibacter sp. IMCC43200]
MPTMPGFDHLRHVVVHAMRPESYWLAIAIALSFAQGLLALLSPWFAGHFASEIMLESSSFDYGLPGLMALWALVLAGQALTRFLSGFLLTRSGARTLAVLSRRLHDHLLALPIPFFESRKRGDLLSLYSNDVASVAHFLTGTLAGLLPAVAVLLGATVMMARIDSQVALLVVLLAPVFFLTLKLLGRGLRSLSDQVAAGQASALGLAGEQLSLIALIKSFNRQHRDGELFASRVRDLLTLRSDQLWWQALLAPALQLLSSLGILLVLWLSAIHLQQGSLELSGFVSLLMYGLLFTRPVSGLANLYGEGLQARGAAQRLQLVFAQAPEPEPEAVSRTALARPGGAIDIARVYFAYPGQKALFESLSLHIPPGEIVAITGDNGAGKSTLLHLLMRFVDPISGVITIGGQNTRKVSLSSLRSLIAIVTQRVLLLDASVADNIRYGMPAATDEAVYAAAGLAQAHAIIQRLPQGYATRIGEGGVRLSGGEQQRIALARALLADPKILILDEATAMFDSQGEADFVANSAAAFAGRTVILVTHRPASLALADRILHLESGVLRQMSVAPEHKEVFEA